MFTYLIPIVVLALFGGVEALNKQEIEAMFMEIMTGCRADNPVTDDEIAQLHDKKLPDSVNAKCLLNCVVSTIGIMQDGMLNEDAAHSIAEQHIDDAEQLNAIKELISSCKGINSQPVSDGNKGCDRAALMFNCMVENHTKFGLPI